LPRWLRKLLQSNQQASPNRTWSIPLMRNRIQGYLNKAGVEQGTRAQDGEDGPRRGAASRFCAAKSARFQYKNGSNEKQNPIAMTQI
jgi:hypothetical protein